MSQKHRSSAPWRGIICVALAAGCCFLLLRARDENPPHAEGPVEVFAIFPVAVLMHIVALTTVGFGPAWNRVLAFTALVSFWGCLGVLW